MTARWSSTGRFAKWLAVAVLGITAVLPRAAQADSAPAGVPPYSASAGADGVRMSVNIPGAPPSADVINGGGPTARAAISSVGFRRGFAALPDPGDGAMAGPGTAAGALGTYGAVLPAAVPPYPFAAVAEYPGTPEQTIGGGPYFAKATSGERSAAGEAQGGFLQESAGVLAARSEAAAEETDAGVLARSASFFKGLVVGPLALGDVKSTAQVSLGLDGAIQRASSLDVVGGRAGDMTFSITGDGFVFGSQNLPVPFDDGVKTLNQQLAASKVKVAFAAQQETGNGVVAPVLEITSPVRSLSPGLPDGTMVVRIGGSGASIDTEASQTVASTPSVPEAAPASEPASLSTTPPMTSTPVAADSAGDVVFSADPGPIVAGAGFQVAEPDASFATSSSVPTAEDASAPEEEFAGATTSPQLLVAGPASRSVEETFGSKSIYLVIFSVALVGLISGRFLRVGGRWNS
jgi:hypothetical protein